MASQAAGVGQQLEQLVAKATKTLALEITANLIEATPVDTGWARANWIPSVGAPAIEVDGVADRAAHTTTAGAAQAAGQAQVLAYEVAQGDVFVSNNVDYVNLLDLRGEAVGFVQDSIDMAVATVQGQFLALTLDVTTPQSLARSGAQNLAAAYSPLEGDA